MCAVLYSDNRVNFIGGDKIEGMLFYKPVTDHYCSSFTVSNLYTYQAQHLVVQTRLEQELQPITAQRFEPYLFANKPNIPTFASPTQHSVNGLDYFILLIVYSIIIRKNHHLWKQHSINSCLC